MLKKIFIALVVIVVAILGYAATRPDSFRVERMALIKAPPETIHPFIADFRQWPQWSPWEKLDPNMQRTFTGPQRGVGAGYAWKGNGKAGEGRMEIVESRPSERVVLKLEFIKPFPATNTTTFTLAPKDGGTEVVWTMEGENTFMGKVFSVFTDMDRLIGKDFEEGLENLDRATKS